MLEPPIQLAASVEQHGLPPESFVVVKHGETISVPLTASESPTTPAGLLVESDRDQDKHKISACQDSVTDEAMKQHGPLTL